MALIDLGMRLSVAACKGPGFAQLAFSYARGGFGNRMAGGRG
jgi:hypothetical protein